MTSKIEENQKKTKKFSKIEEILKSRFFANFEFSSIFEFFLDFWIIFDFWIDFLRFLDFFGFSSIFEFSSRFLDLWIFFDFLDLWEENLAQAFASKTLQRTQNFSQNGKSGKRTDPNQDSLPINQGLWRFLNFLQFLDCLSFSWWKILYKSCVYFLKLASILKKFLRLYFQMLRLYYRRKPPYFRRCVGRGTDGGRNWGLDSQRRNW